MCIHNRITQPKTMVKKSSESAECWASLLSWRLLKRPASRIRIFSGFFFISALLKMSPPDITNDTHRIEHLSSYFTVLTPVKWCSNLAYLARGGVNPAEFRSQTPLQLLEGSARLSNKKVEVHVDQLEIEDF